ncbi:MAG: hypothetical protein ACP5N7_05320 [Candidatus Pacearchaeota archaeon]
MSKQTKVKIKVVKTSADYDRDKVKGKLLFPELYSNIYIAGRKASGKTQLLYNILRYCAGKNTSVLMFAPTVNKDPTYKKIYEMLDEKGIEYKYFENFIDDEGNDLIELFVKNCGKEDKEEDDEPNQQGRGETRIKGETPVIFGDEVPRETYKQTLLKQQELKAELEKKADIKKGGGKLCPDYIICLDDLGDALRKKTIQNLLIKNRHYKTKVVILSQWISYLMPGAIRQLDYVILFGGFPDNKTDDLYRKLDLSITYEEFYKFYKQATEKKYSFLYIDIVKNIFKRNFNDVLYKSV